MARLTSLPSTMQMAVVEEVTTTATMMRGAKEGGGAPMFRPDYMCWWEQQGEYMERRQLFLRSYHFSRKQPPRERMRVRVRGTLLRARRLVWARLRDARRLPRLLWAKLRRAFSGCRDALLGGRSRVARRMRRRFSPRPASSFQFQPLPLPHRRSSSSSSNSSSSSVTASEWPIW